MMTTGHFIASYIENVKCAHLSADYAVNYGIVKFSYANAIIQSVIIVLYIFKLSKRPGDPYLYLNIIFNPAPYYSRTIVINKNILKILLHAHAFNYKYF
jgi:hypothetical protein